MIKIFAMKSFLICILISFLFYSCNSIEFEQPQPLKGNSLKEFPEDIRGKYKIQIVDETSLTSESTVEIHKDYYQESENNKQYFISDSLIVKSYHSDLMVSLLEKGSRFWTVVLIHKEPNGNLLVKSIFSEETNEDILVEKVNHITSVKRIPIEDQKYQYVIDPTKKELGQLVKAGLFKDVYQFIKIDE